MIPADEAPDLEEWVREHIARHNRTVLGLIFLNVAGVAFLWVVLYWVVYWLTLLGASALRGGDAAIPQHFDRAFIVVALALLLGAAMDRMVTTNDLPRDHKGAWEVSTDFVLAIPRATLAIWANITAYRRMDEVEIELATDLVERVLEVDRVPLHSTPLIIPADATRERIVFTLLLTEILYQREDTGITYLQVTPNLRSTLPPPAV